MSLRRLTICWLAMLMAPIIVANGAVIYVDDDSPGGNGSSWATAFEYLQDALSVADANDEIRVAQGMYIPDQDSVRGKLKMCGTFSWSSSWSEGRFKIHSRSSFHF